MTVRKLAVALDLETARHAEASEKREGASPSSWLDPAAAERRRGEAGLAAIADWEAEHGAFTEQELAAADRRVKNALARAARAAERNQRRATETA
jgi:hypothetical protein